MAQSLKKSRIFWPIGTLLFLLGVVAWFVPARGGAPTEGAVVARVDYLTRVALEDLAASLDIWEVHPEEGYLIALLTPQEYEHLTAAGYQVTIDAARTAALSAPRQPLPGQVNGIPGYPCYRTVQETLDTLFGLASAYPNLVELRDIGNSWDKVTPGQPRGYDIWAMRLTNQEIPGPKPAFYLMAEIHAREYTTAELALRFAENLLQSYGTDADATWLLDNFEVHIVPLTNPDGRIFAEQGILWRKNTDNDDGCTDPDGWGTDLNRNHSFLWGGAGSDSAPCGETYRGPAAASEPEVQAIQNDVASIFPDQRGPALSDPAPLDASGVFISLHSYSRLVLWPWGSTSSPAPNSAGLRTLGRKFAFFNGYTAQQSYTLYPTTGTSDDWAYGELGVAAYTFELGNDFFESCSYFENTILPQNLPALKYAFKAARRPYQSPAGPEVINPSLSAVLPGEVTTLTATANDQRYASGEPHQNIAAAHYSIDALSWDAAATFIPLTPADGMFNSPVEAITAQVETACMAPGRHTLYLEAQDSAGNWGVPSAVFLDIVENFTVSLTTETPSQTGFPGDVLTYTLHAANTGNVADTYTVTLSGPWSLAPLTSTLTLQPCEAADWNVLLAIPLDAQSGQSEEARVVLTSQSHPSVVAALQLTAAAVLPPVELAEKQYLPLVISQLP